MNQCDDPDHGAINAERAESRGLRKAWVELDDKRQSLERELTAVTEQRDRLAEVVGVAILALTVASLRHNQDRGTTDFYKGEISKLDTALQSLTPDQL